MRGFARLTVNSTIGALSVLAVDSPAYAQARLGEYVGRLFAQELRYQCMTGQPPSDSEIAEAANPARKVVATYSALAGGAGRLSVWELWDISRHSNLTVADVVVRPAPNTPIDDPITRASASLDPQPESFARAGQGGTARGVWRLRFASGEPAGAYVADFKRKRGVWKLRTLRVLPPGETPPVVTQYCQTPGDVEAYRARMAAVEQARAEKRAAKARAKARRAASPDG